MDILTYSYINDTLRKISSGYLQDSSIYNYIYNTKGLLQSKYLIIKDDSLISHGPVYKYIYDEHDRLLYITASWAENTKDSIEEFKCCELKYKGDTMITKSIIDKNALNSTYTYIYDTNHNLIEKLIYGGGFSKKPSIHEVYKYNEKGQLIESFSKFDERLRSLDHKKYYYNKYGVIDHVESYNFKNKILNSMLFLYELL